MSEGKGRGRLILGLFLSILASVISGVILLSIEYNLFEPNNSDGVQGLPPTPTPTVYSRPSTPATPSSRLQSSTSSTTENTNTQPMNTTSGSQTPASGDNILYGFGGMGDRAQIYLMNIQTYQSTVLADGSNPQWSLDRSQIVYELKVGGYSSIFIMNADGSNPQKLSTYTVNDITPSISPDGEKIVFASDRSSTWQIYIMDADGSNQQKLTNTLEDNGAPVFSPDGRTIAFQSERDGHSEIYLMNPDGSNQRRITDGDNRQSTDCDGNLRYSENWKEMNSIAPKWSPDGESIIFSGGWERGHQACQDWDIFVMDADGSNLRRLQIWDSNEYDAAFSADGSRIIFRSAPLNTGYDIFISELNIENRERIFDNNDYFDVISGISWYQ